MVALDLAGLTNVLTFTNNVSAALTHTPLGCLHMQLTTWGHLQVKLYLLKLVSA